jgi:hypothetical protein
MESSEAARGASALPTYDRAALPVAETALPRSERLRLSLIGVAIGAGSLAACTVLGLLIRAAVYGA